MARVFKLRIKTSYSGVPKGFEFQHVDTQHYSTPTPEQVKATLINLGFKDAKNTCWNAEKYDVISFK